MYEHSAGWLVGDPLRANSSDGSLNWGLQDMRAALAFLRTTGAAFGGNPEAITLYGESSGGGAVSLFLTNARASGMFARAITESGPIADWVVSRNYSTAAADYPKLAAALGCPTSGEASLVCMRAAPYATVMSAGETVGANLGGPVLDGVEVQARAHARRAPPRRARCLSRG